MERGNAWPKGSTLSLLSYLVLLASAIEKKNLFMNREERKKQYELLCNEKKIKPLFMQPWWLNATGPWDVSLAYRNNRLIGAMPFATGRRWGISYLGMPAFTHHMQIW